MKLDAPTAGIAQIFHFADPVAWQRAQTTGRYAPDGFAVEGFIHAATAEQIAGVVDRHLRGHGPRVQLTIECAALGDILQWEWSNASGDLYPHLFGPIPLNAVVASEPFDPDGQT
jgi:uncharacterized protein (DUF952 family)